MTQQKKSNFIPVGVKFILVLCLIYLTMLFIIFKEAEIKESIKYIPEETKTLVINENIKFSEEKLKEFILQLNIRFPHIVLAQAKLESGYFKSKMFKENHNLFGMKVARKRPTTNKGEQFGHAYFDNWKDCVVDYAFYQAAYLSDIKTEEQYYLYLSANYAEDEEYVSKIKKLASKLK